jgi:hypothetical protein
VTAGLGPPAKEERSGPHHTDRSAPTGTSTVTAEGLGVASIGNPADIGRARHVVEGLRRHRWGARLGCPMGCPLGWHEPPCAVDSDIDDAADYDESGIFTAPDGEPRLTSLRLWREGRVA